MSKSDFAMQAHNHEMSCACGKVKCRSQGSPIVAGVCYCDDCQAGARLIEAMDGAPKVLDADGGANYLTYRDDRFSCVEGEELLRPVKLREKSLTTRYVASCCNSAMYLKFNRGHWVSTYRNQYEGETPPVEMRTQTRFRDNDLPFPDDAPVFRKWPLRLFGKLIAARFAMMVGR